MKEQTFEASIERLESIVKQLETGNISLSGPASELINDENIKKAYLGE